MTCICTSSFACSPASITASKADNITSNLEMLLGLDTSKPKPELGILYSSGFNGKINSGWCSDDNAWGFDILGDIAITCRGETVSLCRDNLEYEMRRFCISVKHFHMIRNYRTVGNQTLTRLDLCLPEEYCSELSQLYSAMNATREMKVDLIGRLTDHMRISLQPTKEESSPGWLQ